MAGGRERAVGSLKYERLYREDITDGLWLAEHADAFRVEFNHLRPMKRCRETVPSTSTSAAHPDEPNFPTPELFQGLRTPGHCD